MFQAGNKKQKDLEEKQRKTMDVPAYLSHRERTSGLRYTQSNLLMIPSALRIIYRKVYISRVCIFKNFYFQDKAQSEWSGSLIKCNSSFIP